MTASFVICTKDREDDIRKALQSIAVQDRLPEEVVIVDSGRDEMLGQRLAGELPAEVRLVYVRSKPGLTLQRNVGVENSSGDVLMFIDDDVILETGYVSSVLEAFSCDEDGTIGAVQGRITNAVPAPAALPRQMTRALRRGMARLFLLSDQGDGRMKASGFPSFTYPSDKPGYVECLAGGCMSFRKGVFEKIRFDEALSGYACWEDVDITRQVLGAGYHIYYAPAARLGHFPSPSSRASASQVAAMRMLHHHYLYHKHWDGSVRQRAGFAWSMLGLLVMHASKNPLREGVGSLRGLGQVIAGRNPLLSGSGARSADTAETAHRGRS